ncbi:hypothetical protein ElyMa_006217300 [Elysia marginata]|uniref:Uncharacterized protein n=1 Tax=Elysia marginata TaxID=1093978 RepID=A0AAV4H4U7_9GAST|nr:hypothetical protein ElyMa_006217300 [Elysia marginata]
MQALLASQCGSTLSIILSAVSDITSKLTGTLKFKQPDQTADTEEKSVGIFHFASSRYPRLCFLACSEEPTQKSFVVAVVAAVIVKEAVAFLVVVAVVVVVVVVVFSNSVTA